MNFDIEFLKIAKVYNESLDEHNLFMRQHLSLNTVTYYDNLSSEELQAAVGYILELVYDRDLERSHKSIKELADNWSKAIDFMNANLVEGLLSENKFIRAFAEQTYSRQSQIKKQETAKKNKAWFRSHIK